MESIGYLIFDQAEVSFAKKRSIPPKFTVSIIDDDEHQTSRARRTRRDIGGKFTALFTARYQLRAIRVRERAPVLYFNG